MNQVVINSPVGFLKVCDNGSAITEISFVSDDLCVLTSEDCASELANKAIKQLTEYFNGSRKGFALPLTPKGTAFQREVWNALLEIPYGEIRSYKDIAIAVGREKGAQAVGQANHKNPIAIVIPCHRVLGKSGKLVGYGGGIEKQRYLLHLEQAY